MVLVGRCQSRGTFTDVDFPHSKLVGNFRPLRCLFYEGVIWVVRIESVLVFVECCQLHLVPFVCDLLCRHQARNVPKR